MIARILRPAPRQIRRHNKSTHLPSALRRCFGMGLRAWRCPWAPAREVEERYEPELSSARNGPAHFVGFCPAASSSVT